MSDVNREHPGPDIDLDDVANFSNPSDAKLPDGANDLQRCAVFDKLIVMPMKRPEKTSGGIIISSLTHAREQYMSHFGKLVAMGPLAYRHKKWRDMGIGGEKTLKKIGGELKVVEMVPMENAIPKIGDWIAYSYHAILDRFEYRGLRFIILADNSLMMKLPPDANPWEFTVIP